MYLCYVWLAARAPVCTSFFRVSAVLLMIALQDWLGQSLWFL